MGSKRVNASHARKRIPSDIQMLQIQQAQNHAVNSLEDSLSPVRHNPKLLQSNYNQSSMRLESANRKSPEEILSFVKAHG